MSFSVIRGGSLFNKIKNLKIDQEIIGNSNIMINEKK